jgi:hypothetical protein
VSSLWRAVRWLLDRGHHLTTFLRNLLCWLLDHQEVGTIEYGWDVVRCRRCGETLATEPVRETAP